MKIDYLRAMVQFGENSDNYYNLQPAEEWGRSTAPLEEVIKYTKDPDGYVPPKNEKIFFKAFSLGHYKLCAVLECSPSDLTWIDFSATQIKKFTRSSDQEVHNRQIEDTCSS